MYNEGGDWYRLRCEYVQYYVLVLLDVAYLKLYMVLWLFQIINKVVSRTYEVFCIPPLINNGNLMFVTNTLSFLMLVTTNTS